MDFFSNSKPELIDPSIQKQIDKIIKKGGNKKTPSEKISTKIIDFYKTYISQYKFCVFIIVVVVIFLIYRYYSNKTSKSKEQKKNIQNIQNEKIYDDIYNDIMRTEVQNKTPDKIPDQISVIKNDTTIINNHKLDSDTDTSNTSEKLNIQSIYQYDDLYNF